MIATPIRWIVRRLRRTPVRDSRQTLKDRVLAYRLYRTFERDLELASIHGIHFYVQHGTVTLYGTIRHELDRALLVSLVQQIPGVRSVVEHLQPIEPAFQDLEGEIVMRLPA